MKGNLNVDGLIPPPKDFSNIEIGDKFVCTLYGEIWLAGIFNTGDGFLLADVVDGSWVVKEDKLDDMSKYLSENADYFFEVESLDFNVKVK